MYRNIKIDLVYTWVDGNDEFWLRKKNIYLKNNLSEKYSEATQPSRYREAGELKYSLRSVEKYAPWINNIYIITDNQIPVWLNTDNPKITIVDHKEIIPKNALPTFNSVAIEMCIDNIPKLSEYFLYANDDVFFADYVTPDFFYKKDGYPIFRFKKNLRNRNRLYGFFIDNSMNAIYKKYKKKYTFVPHHCIDAYRKSNIKECKKIFKNEIEQNIYSKFRNDKNCERIIFAFYALATKKGHPKIIKRASYNITTLKKIINRIFKLYYSDSLVIPKTSNCLKEQFELYKPKIACINDRQSATDENEKTVYKFYENMFPNKSSFEK